MFQNPSRLNKTLPSAFPEACPPAEPVFQNVSCILKQVSPIKKDGIEYRGKRWEQGQFCFLKETSTLRDLVLDNTRWVRTFDKTKLKHVFSLSDGWQERTKHKMANNMIFLKEKGLEISPKTTKPPTQTSVSQLCVSGVGHKNIHKLFSSLNGRIVDIQRSAGSKTAARGGLAPWGSNLFEKLKMSVL